MLIIPFAFNKQYLKFLLCMLQLSTVVLEIGAVIMNAACRHSVSTHWNCVISISRPRYLHKVLSFKFSLAAIIPPDQLAIHFCDAT